MRLIREYNRVQNMSQKEISLLGFMIAYPEKYWKQVNFYFNNSKSWISEKNIEKIKRQWNKIVYALPLLIVCCRSSCKS